MNTQLRPFRALTGLVLLTAMLAGCNTVDRLANVGKAPDLAPMPAMPMPAAEHVTFQPNSLWRSGSRAFFRDQRAARVGDILTVVINIDDSAKVGNTTKRTRANSENSSMDNLLGFETRLNRVFPNAVNPSSLSDLASDSSSAGAGSVDRKENIALTIAAVVTGVMPNGNLVIEGKQEVRVNFEVRELLVQGIVRPEDISNSNTISNTQIAEARISYGGRGQISDVQQPRYGQQIYDILWPF